MGSGSLNTDSYSAGTLLTELSSQPNLCSDSQGKEKIGVADELGALISYALFFCSTQALFYGMMVAHIG